ncbi:MAG TPA: hypothetical protein DCR24_09215 [Bacillus bacterium]|nr:hypothetical protein [Bacillus sp. (in: firmicutes)]
MKKTEPELPKAKPVTPPAPGVEKKNDRGQNGNSYNSQSKNNYEKKVQQVVKSKSSNNGRQVKEERNRLKQDNNGHSGKSNGNSNKK